MQAGIDDFAQVVRRNVRRHADRDAGRAIDQQIGDARRENERLAFAAVVVRTEVDGFLVDVGQQLVADLRHADFGVAHGGGVVAVDRTEVALAVDQHVAQRERLRHANDRLVDGGVAVRMIFTDHVADDTRRLLVGAIPVVVQLVHRVQRATMHRLQAIADIGKRAPDDHAHRVIEIRAAHFLLKGDWQSLFGELIHYPCLELCAATRQRARRFRGLARRPRDMRRRGA